MKIKPYQIALWFVLSIGCAHAATPDPAIDQNVRDTLRAMSDASTWGHPDQFGQFAGMQRYAKGDYAAALKYFRLGARYADKLSQLSIGLMYANGEGVAADPVLAYAWTAVAAERGYPQFVATRDRIFASLTPTQQLRAAQARKEIAAEYGDAVAKPRMTRELNYWRSQMTGSRTGFDSGVKHLDKGMLSGGVPSANCARRRIGGTPIAGCGGDIYAKWRWDPKIYYQVLDARWSGTVTVGPLEQITGSAAKPAEPAHTAPPKAGH